MKMVTYLATYGRNPCKIHLFTKNLDLYHSVIHPGMVTSMVSLGEFRQTWLLHHIFVHPKCIPHIPVILQTHNHFCWIYEWYPQFFLKSVTLLYIYITRICGWYSRFMVGWGDKSSYNWGALLAEDSHFKRNCRSFSLGKPFPSYLCKVNGWYIPICLQWWLYDYTPTFLGWIHLVLHSISWQQRCTI